MDDQNRQSGAGHSDGPRARVAWLLVALGIALVVAVLSLTASTPHLASEPTAPSTATAAVLPRGTILTVNTDPIDSREFALELESNEAQVFQYFHDHFGVRDSAHFWTRPHGGVTPLSMLKRVTTAQVVRLTVQLEMARDRGFTKGISYADLVGNVNDVNKQRSASVAEGKPVYGPTSFTEQSYFGYVTGDVQANLVQSLEQELQPPAIPVLESLYADLRDQDFLCATASQTTTDGTAECPNGATYIPFTAVEPQVLQAWSQNQVAKLIAERVSVAKVTVNHSIYDTIAAP